jgi:hypothetical protein
MLKLDTHFRHHSWRFAILLSAVVAGCGGGDDGRDPLLGADIVPTPPAVTAETPADGASAVPIGNPMIAAVFNQPMAAITGGASFTVTCAAPCANPTGTVALDAAATTATFTLATGTRLEPLTLYTGTITGATSLASGLPLASPFVWSFTTGPAPATPPTVTAVAPVNDATGVPLNIAGITAAFSQPVTAIASGGASFTVTCAGPCSSPAGTATLNAAGTIATFAPGALLEPLTLYTGTVTGVASVAGGLVLVNPFVWTFTTGATLDTTRPRVTVTVPATTSPGPTANVAANTAVTAVFTEDMAPTTLTDTSFTLVCSAPCVSPGGTVSYAVGSRTAVFTPTAVLADGTTYTATVTTAATDLAGNQLAGNQAALPAASDYVWTFTTAGTAPPADVSVLLTEPLDSGSMCPNGSISASFAVPSGLRMDPNTVNTLTFTVTGPGPGLVPVTAASVLLDTATGRIATFTPLSDLTPGDVYTAEITGGATGVKDLAIPANSMLSDFTWSFTVAPPTGDCLQAVALNSAAPFGTFGGTAGMTNTGIQTIVNGDIGTIATGTSTVTGFHDTAGDVYTEVIGANIGTVNGIISTCTTSTTGPTSAAVNPVACTIATNARLDAEAAYLELAGLPGGPDPGAGNLANLVLAPGVYTAALGTFMIEGGDLTLDAQGDANAVWVFQMAASLTVGGPGAAAPQSITLVNGADGKNVFWQVGTAATINAGGGGTMEGTIISQAGVTFSTVGNTIVTTLNGRALSLGASVTLVDTVINVPAP